MALFNMADQYSTTESSTVELPTSDSKKRPLDGAGEGRPSYKRSNLGGRYSYENLLGGVWKLCLVSLARLCHDVLRREVGIFAL